MEDCRVVELRHRSEPAEFPGELHECEIPPDKGEDAGGELHPSFGWIILSRYAHGSRNEETRIDINSRLYFYTEVDRHRWGLRYRYTVDINNNPQQTWGRTDYIKGDITGNTWDTIKTQTKTNQLMMGNRKDHIRVRRQRQRKTKSDNNRKVAWLIAISNIGYIL